MIQKFIISLDIESHLLKIKELTVIERIPKNGDLSNLNEDNFSLLHEETYDSETIALAISKSKEALISSLRTQSLYPIESHAELIAKSVMDLYQSKNTQSVDLLIDDFDFD
jgi:hypothetical protein